MLGTTKNSKNGASQSWEQHFPATGSLFYLITNLIHKNYGSKKDLLPSAPALGALSVC